jgi:2-polyprenyl-3-methyl-5-hydroxy-6-metoxy-1,4-benzoquinol methylase
MMKEIADTSNTTHNLNILKSSFGSLQNKKFEFSYTLKPHHIETRGRWSCWVEGNTATDFSAVAGVISQLHAPEKVRKAQAMLENPVVQGIGFSEDTYRLYLHGRKTATQKDFYKAWRWGPDTKLKAYTYTFQFWSSIYNEIAVENFIPKLLLPAFNKLISNKRFQQMSGCWIRYNEQCLIDQVNICFPWHPLAGSLQGYMLLLELLEINPLTYPALEEFPVRHITFKTDKNFPCATLYTAAPADHFWPGDEDSLQSFVLSAARTYNEQTEKRVFAALPSLNINVYTNQISKFYDDSIATWKQVLGDKMHYHHGIFKSNAVTDVSEEDMQQALDYAVSTLYPLLPKSGRIYDIGCGWGGPMSMIINDLQCRVLGLTPRLTQFKYITEKGFDVRLGDAEKTLPPGYFDCVLMLESFSHILDKENLLHILKRFSSRLVMRVNCQDHAPSGATFGGSMHMISSNDLKDILQKTGWTIRHWANVRQTALPSAPVWNKRLQSIPVTNDKHIETFRLWCTRIINNLAEWGANNPLIEVMAE